MRQSECELRLDDGRSVRVQFMLPDEGADPIADQLAAGVLQPTSPIRWLLCVIEPEDRVLDLGAHLGTFALPAAWIGARVTAVEASPTNAELLREAAAANGLEEHLTVVEAAVSGTPGTVEFVDMGPYGTIETARLGRAAGWKTVRVEARTIDGLWTRAQWMKLDIEGAEVSALGSAEETLLGIRGLVTESNGYMLHEHGTSPEALLTILGRAGLDVYAVDGQTLAPLGPRRFQPETTVDYVAVRGAPGLPPGWELGAARPPEDDVGILEKELRHPVPQHRAYALAVATRAPRSIRYRPGIRRALRDLESDDNPHVVAARERLRD